MMNEPENFPSMFRIDVSAEPSSAEPGGEIGTDEMIVALLRQLVVGQERQTQLLEELNQGQSQAQKQRANELGQWKEANPRLAKGCRSAAETLSRVQTRFLETLTEEIADNEECLLDGDFMLNEFVDRFGPRLAHLNGVLQVLSQLSNIPESNNAQQS